MSACDYFVAVPCSRVSVLRDFRRLTGVEVCASNADVIWVRGPQSDEDVLSALRTLPGRHFTANDTDGLVPVGRRLVAKPVPQGTWQLLRQWISVSLPPARWAGRSDTTMPLKLTPSKAVRPATAVLTTIEQLSSFASTALDIRLQRLQFAMNQQGHVFVIGTPLPAVSGQRFWIQNDVAVPAGMCWTPNVDAPTVRQTMTDKAGMVVWFSTEHWELIPEDAFTAVARSSLNASQATADRNLLR